MRVEKLNPSHEVDMIELFKSDQDNSNVEFFIDRPAGFWKPYNEFSKDETRAWGVFEGQALNGMTALVPLPFHFDLECTPVFLNTDYFVHFTKRKSQAAYLLLKSLQTQAPHFDHFEIGVENQPGFLEVLPRFSKKFGHRTIWLKNTVLQQFFVSKKMKDSQTGILDVNFDFNKIDSYLRGFKLNQSNHGTRYQENLAGLATQHRTSFFEFKQEGEFIRGLLIDKTKSQKLIWNGQARLHIEKFRRMLKTEFDQDFKSGDELPFLLLNFVESDIKTKTFVENFISKLNNYCFENKFFCWNIRDQNLRFSDHFEIHTVKFERRIPLTAKKPDSILRLNINQQNKNAVLESIFI
jgi:hypothetical protein